MTTGIGHRSRWGRWYYNSSTLTLVFDSGHGVMNWYVDLERCGDSAEILDWILQFAQKEHPTAADIGNLVIGLNELADGLQEKVCPGGQNQRFDFKAHLL